MIRIGDKITEDLKNAAIRLPFSIQELATAYSCSTTTVRTTVNNLIAAGIVAPNGQMYGPNGAPTQFYTAKVASDDDGLKHFSNKQLLAEVARRLAS